MRAISYAFVVVAAFALGGCGLIYQAGSGIRGHRMSESLRVGESMLEVHKKWGEPDIRSYPASNVEVWSYAVHPNTNDMTATLLYTSTKPGDTGTFLDLKFINGKLASWGKGVHTMPAKQGAGFSASFGAPGGPNTAYHF